MTRTFCSRIARGADVISKLFKTRHPSSRDIKTIDGRYRIDHSQTPPRKYAQHSSRDPLETLRQAADRSCCHALCSKRRRHRRCVAATPTTSSETECYMKRGHASTLVTINDRLVLWRMRGSIEELSCAARPTTFGYTLGLELGGEPILLELQSSVEVLVDKAAKLEAWLLTQGWQPVPDEQIAPF
jgi:hypothetical protein